MLAIITGLTFVLSVSFVLYIIMILVPYLRYPPTTAGNPSEYDWHFLVPCRDEEAVVATTIERARSNFPLAHIWVIDDDSDDRTLEIVQSYAAVDDHVHLVARKRPEARLGKGAALNAAYTEIDAWLPSGANREKTIITVIDADGELADNALDIVSSDTVFGETGVGAAQISVRMKNRDDSRPRPDKGWLGNQIARLLVRMQDIEFRTSIAAMQSLRARTGTVGLGGNGQFTRLSILDAITKEYGEPWHGSLLEDYELGLHVLLAGSTTKHVYDTHVSQEALPSFRRLITQRTRWAQGNIECASYIPQIVRSPHVTSGGVLETSYYLVLPYLQAIGMLALTLVLGYGVVNALTNPDALATYAQNAGATAILLVLFSIAPFAMWGPIYRLRCEPQLGVWTGIGYGICLWLYIYYMYLVLPRAFYRKFTGQGGWAKTRRNAEVTVQGAPIAINY